MKRFLAGILLVATLATSAVAQKSLTTVNGVVTAPVAFDQVTRADVLRLNWVQANLGTVAGGGTIALTTANTKYRVTTTGATATVTLPASPSDGVYVIDGYSTYASGRQVITVPELVRPEQDPDTAQTSFGIAASSGSQWTAVFTAVNGEFVKFSVDGDDLALGGAGADGDAVHVDVAGEFTGLTAKATPSTSDILLIEDAADSGNKKKVTAGTLPVSTATQAAIDAKVSDAAYDSTNWNDDTDAPSKNSVRDAIEALGAGTLFTTKMGVLWPTADLASKPSGWMSAGEGGTTAAAAIGDYSLIVKAEGTVADPVLSPATGTYATTQNVSITSATSGATIKFTTDGVPPSRDYGTVYSDAFDVVETDTIKAIAYKDTYIDSQVVTETYTIEAAPSLAVDSAVISSSGDTITVNFTDSVTVGAGGGGGLAATVTEGAAGTNPSAVTLTYSSGSPGTALVYTTSRTINPAAVETIELSYTQPTDGIEATTGGEDLATFSGFATTNSSTTQTYTLQETMGSSSVNVSLADTTTNRWVASKRTSTASYVLTKLEINMLRVNSPSFSIAARVLADSAGIPGSILATSTNSISSADVTTAEAFTAFLFAGTPITSSSIYWFTPQADTNGSTAYYRLRAGASSTGDLDSSNDGVTWAGYNNRALNMKAYSSP